MSFLRPDRYCQSVLDIDPASLAEAGVEGVLLDLDNTLLPRGSEDIPPAVVDWVGRLKGQQMGVCLISNTAKPRVHAAARVLDIPAVVNARKPLKGGYVQACGLLGIEPERAVMVGDQTYTDILGAHRCGMRGVLVVPSSENDLFHTRLLRALDALAVRGMEPERLDREARLTCLDEERRLCPMHHTQDLQGVNYRDFVLIGDPVGHSLSPVMHNALYRDLAKVDRHFSTWRYEALRCEDEKSAKLEIGRVRTGHYSGMNVTMPYKRLALSEADYVDSSADAAGGANVLVRKERSLYAYNTDGLGALGAISRVGGIDPRGKRVAVCGTGPTSVAIAAAFANAGAGQVTVFSRQEARAESTIERLALSLERGADSRLRAADYEQAGLLVPDADVFVDATPRGMGQGDAAIVDTTLFHEGQVVLDVVYGHGLTELVAGARRAGAFAMDGLEMLVEQAALSVEIWAEAMGLSVTVSREVMRQAAENAQRTLQ